MEHGTIRFGTVDWTSQGHAACLVEAGASPLDEFEVMHADAGLTQHCRPFRRSGVQCVAITRPDGLAVTTHRAFRTCQIFSGSGSTRSRPGCGGVNSP